MSWLDDMEAADPAYPSPREADPWAAPDYAPDTSRAVSPEVANIIGNWARQHNAPGPYMRPGPNYDLDAVRASAQERPGLYELHARLDDGHLNAARELIADWYQRQAGYVSGVPHGGPGRDWQLIRVAEANAREIGLRASVPQPGGYGTPEYEADAAAWGSGRGIEPGGPEVG
jgi:hypothetical protein